MVTPTYSRAALSEKTIPYVEALKKRFGQEVFCGDYFRDELGAGGRKAQQLLASFLIKLKTGMTFGDFQVGSAPMNNHPTCHVQQMKAQCFQPGDPPRARQGLSFPARQGFVLYKCIDTAGHIVENRRSAEI
jgi:hypothetical protein